MNAQVAPVARLMLISCVLLLVGCGSSADPPGTTSMPPVSAALPENGPLDYVRSVDADASLGYYEANRDLFTYDRTAPIDIQEISSRTEDGLTITELTYASPHGGRVPATLIVPKGRGPFAGIVMQRSMEIEFGMRYAEHGAVVLYVDAPSFRPGHPEPRGILTFTEQDRREQIQLTVDLRRAIDVLAARSDVDPDRLAYLGVSYGGAMGGLLAGIEDRLQAYVLIVGDGGFVTHQTNPANLTMSLHEFSVEYGAWIDAMWPIEPIHYVRHAAPTPILFQNATLDQYVDVQDALRYQQAAGDNQRVMWYQSQHWPLPDVAMEDGAMWLQPHIGCGELYLVPGPNYRPLAVVLDRLLLGWLLLTGLSMAMLVRALRRDGNRHEGNAGWIVLVALLGVIGLTAYYVTERRTADR